MQQCVEQSRRRKTKNKRWINEKNSQYNFRIQTLFLKSLYLKLFITVIASSECCILLDRVCAPVYQHIHKNKKMPNEGIRIHKTAEENEKNI